MKASVSKWDSTKRVACGTEGQGLLLFSGSPKTFVEKLGKPVFWVFTCLYMLKCNWVMRWINSSSVDTSVFSSRNRLSMFLLWYCSASTNSHFVSGFGRITWSFLQLCFPFCNWLKFLEAIHCYFCLEMFFVTVIISNTDNGIVTAFFRSIQFSLWVFSLIPSFLSLANFLFTGIPLEYLFVPFSRV